MRMAGATIPRRSVAQVVRQARMAASADRCEPERRLCPNTLNGNGLQETGFLDRDYASVYTKPDETDNRSVFLNLSRSFTAPRAGLTLSGSAYFRHIGTDTFNGDINEDSLDQAVYQPNAAERAALVARATPVCR